MVTTLARLDPGDRGTISPLRACDPLRRVRASDVAVLDLEAGPKPPRSDCGRDRRAPCRGWPDAIVLGCAGMADLAARHGGPSRPAGDRRGRGGRRACRSPATRPMPTGKSAARTGTRHERTGDSPGEHSPNSRRRSTGPRSRAGTPALTTCRLSRHRSGWLPDGLRRRRAGLRDFGGALLRPISAFSASTSSARTIAAPAPGDRIWNAGMAQLAGRTVGLDGVVAQQDNYRKSGFVLAGAISAIPAFATTGRAIGRRSARSGPSTTADLPLLCAYDRAPFPAARDSFVRHWALPASRHAADGCWSHRGRRDCRISARSAPAARAQDRAALRRTHDIAEALFSRPGRDRAADSEISLDTPGTTHAAVAMAHPPGWFRRSRPHACIAAQPRELPLGPASSASRHSNWADRIAMTGHHTHFDFAALNKRERTSC